MLDCIVVKTFPQISLTIYISRQLSTFVDNYVYKMNSFAKSVCIIFAEMKNKGYHGVALHAHCYIE